MRLSIAQILLNMDFKVGDYLDGKTSNQIIEQLFETNWFDDVIVGLDGSTLVISVVERPLLMEIAFDGRM